MLEMLPKFDVLVLGILVCGIVILLGVYFLTKSAKKNGDENKPGEEFSDVDAEEKAWRKRQVQFLKNKIEWSRRRLTSSVKCRRATKEQALRYLQEAVILTMGSKYGQGRKVFKQAKAVLLSLSENQSVSPWIAKRSQEILDGLKPIKFTENKDPFVIIENDEEDEPLLIAEA